ncbi:hypothetical protein B0H19DRAFT_1078064 [Mycena capillaripes]|nr:hypothetical protein B0H19DRAFT_1078064 [Mycena capillaripes]
MCPVLNTPTKQIGIIVRPRPGPSCPAPICQQTCGKLLKFKAVRGRQEDGTLLCPVLNTATKQLGSSSATRPGPSCSAVTHFSHMPVRIEPFPRRLLFETTNIIADIEPHENLNELGMIWQLQSRTEQGFCPRAGVLESGFEHIGNSEDWPFTR